VTDRVPFRRLASLARSPWGIVVVAAWSFGEAIVVPVVPDVLLGLLVLVAPRRAVPLFLAAVAGSLLGSVVLWVLVVADPAAVRSVLLALPGLGPEVLADASGAVAGGDPRSTVLVGMGTPLKAYTYAWALGPATPAAFAVAVVANRLTRVGPFVLVMAALGWLAPDWIRRHDRLVLAAYAAFWVGVYVIYWG
jgi:membrane protein YqaA with SNARE-associated domain